MGTTTPPAPTALEPLAIRNILTSALPGELGTDQEPERYTVHCVLSRRVEQAEQRLLVGADAHERLREGGYPTPRLTLSDRRLLVHDTNLEELSSGLATLLAAVLRDVTDVVTTQNSERARTVSDLADREKERSDRVRGQAEAIDFS